MNPTPADSEPAQYYHLESLIPQLSRELGYSQKQISGTLALLLSDNTIPFIARYRKEATGNLDELQIESIQNRYHYLKDLDERRNVILDSIRQQDKLTPELEKAIRAAPTKQQLEDLYLPYKPKRRTRATAAREKGLEPLSELMMQAETSLKQLGVWISEFNGKREEPVSEEDAVQGAKDILAELVSEDASLRQQLREYTSKNGSLVSQVKKEHQDKPSKFEMYYDFEERLDRIPPHRVLAMRRGEKEGILRIHVLVPEKPVQEMLQKSWMKERSPELKTHWQQVLDDAYQRLLAPALETDVRIDLKLKADESSIEMFSKNLRQLLLLPPGGARVVLGLDPAFRTGTKWVVLDATGRYLEHGVIYPVPPQNKTDESLEILHKTFTKHKVNVIAIGNGTASREVHQFVRKFVKNLKLPLETLVVNESGASVYSASKTAREEFPDLDLTVRGAISIARRYQDPLAELVKIEPKSIGVGQYQHDVHQSRLKQSLARTVESCVNFVGVDLNRASAPLLGYVSGISASVARGIIEHRNGIGAFKDRKQLLEVKGLGEKTFEQSAGFLRIPEGCNPLDCSAVHPEHYQVVEAMARDLEISVEGMIGNSERLKQIETARYQGPSMGEYTLKDIIAELHKPGRDPRQDHQTVEFDESVQELSDLEAGMRLQGVITNVTHFGAFVDVGVHHDGLVHISQLSDRFVKDPMEVCTVGQHVQVTVLQVDEDRQRVSLSMKSGMTMQNPERIKTGKKPKKTEKPLKKPQKRTPPEKTGEFMKKKTTGVFEKDMELLMEKFNKRQV